MLRPLDGLALLREEELILRWVKWFVGDVVKILQFADNSWLFLILARELTAASSGVF